MNAAQMLVPPSDEDTRTERQKTMWTVTQERIDRFLPGFLAEVVAPPPSPIIKKTQSQPPG